MSSSKKLYEIRKLAHICVKCGKKPAKQNHTACEECLESQRVYAKTHTLKKMKMENTKTNKTKETIKTTKTIQKLKELTNFDKFKNEYLDLKTKHLNLFQIDVVELLDKYFIE